MSLTHNISLAAPTRPGKIITLLAAGFTLSCFVCNATAADSVESADTLSFSTRIIGGVETSIDEAPATAALLRTSQVELDGDLFQAQFCGGTVIAPRWIMTAAHCVVDQFGNVASPESIMVLTGSSDLVNPVNQPIVVERIIAHELFENVEAGNDIALLQLQLDALVDPVAVDTQTAGIDEPAFIAGWGATNSPESGRTQQFPTQLLGTYVSMSNGPVCGDRQPEYAESTDERMLCAGISEGGKDTCQGDSGGPLYRVDSDSNAITAVSGITSWGISCGVADYPGVYTAVSAYTDWIQSNSRSAASLTAGIPANDGTNTSAQSDEGAFDSESDDSSDSDSLLGSQSPTLLIALASVLFWRRRRSFAC